MECGCRMTVSEFVIDEIIKLGITDCFGVPGGVILKLLYALDDRKDEIEPHLTYHEQTAGFAALGYAQASGKLGFAYATRGPGISNMFSAIAEAYQESLPVLFITAHGERNEKNKVRFLGNQEMNVAIMVKDITKFSANIDNEEDVVSVFRKACRLALTGRKGPVLLDFSSSIWTKKILISEQKKRIEDNTQGHAVYEKNIDNILNEITEAISFANRPLLLIGDGLRHSVSKEQLVELAEKMQLPIVSSRGSLDLLSGSRYYYGYIGSHGIRYSNFILSKSDLLVSIGNRMAYSPNSSSFAPMIKKKQLIRIDIDESELSRNLSDNETTYCCDAKVIIQSVYKRISKSSSNITKVEWIDVCNELKRKLVDEDCGEAVNKICDFISNQSLNSSFVCDVGNNEFWFCHAYEKTNCKKMVYQSKSFGTLGASIGRAIGVYYATHNEVICIIGDHGFQYNIQELQYIYQHNLPIKIMILNNHCSKMIADHEANLFSGRYIHVDSSNGYTTPDFRAISKAYKLSNQIYELKVDTNHSLYPNLPKGSEMQDMEPRINREKYMRLNEL